MLWALLRARALWLFVLLGIPGGTTSSLSAENEVVFTTVARHRVSDGKNLLFVDLSANARTLVYASESNTVGNHHSDIYWSRGPLFDRVWHLRLSASVLAWDITPDGTMLALACDDGHVRLIRFSDSACVHVTKLSIPRIRGSGEGGAPRGASLCFTNGRSGPSLLVCVGGQYVPATLIDFALGPPARRRRSRRLDGMVLILKGTWDSPIITNMNFIRRDDREGKVLYRIRAPAPIVITSKRLGIHVSANGYGPITIGVWELGSGKVLRTLRLPEGSLAGMPAVRVATRELFVVRKDGNLVQWNFGTEQQKVWRSSVTVGENDVLRRAFVVVGKTAYLADVTDDGIVIVRKAKLPDGE